MAQKLEAKGGKGGNQWDDGADHENVTKIHVRGGLEGIQFIKFEYVKAGQTVVGPIHGVSGKGFTQTFEINHLNDEHLVSVKGCYDNISGVIQALQFETNERSSEVMGYDDNGTKFTLEVSGNKITGFHGSAEANLKSLGAYFTPLAPIKLEYQGSTTGGRPWDHGIYTGVRKIYVTYSPSGISHIKVDYDKNGEVETRQDGDMLGENRVLGQQNEFVVDYPYEYVTSIEGTCDIVSGSSNRVRSLSFKTSKDRTSPTYGHKGERTFVFESRGRALVGLHGRGGFAIDAIGAHFGAPLIPPPPPTEKLQGSGGDGGESWDDGAFDGVRKIYVGQGNNGIASVKFVYDKNNQLVLGEEHGKQTLLGYEEFELEYPSEYITAVEGYYDKVFGSESSVIVMLKFKTNKRTSPPFGMDAGVSFILGKEGHKVVGFHGKARPELYQIGVSVAPITK
ncbi:Jacalin-like lectin domain superfamily [Arabidopsis thaliana x Arabidopsis arenosa]|uniref:Jacalin-like lectin domain superfamily n=1 Tax=Arabidopsis thaliana x Arabidopsis arenosa TaxID=1240361 RepID=A0A8T2A571_9BRAS|nr:Jacalin-like lectin domain superfamily [Arabidopsis thaliana x Arabidopsis arenosa]